MKVTIIGCGYVGTAVACRLHQLGYFVTATTTTPERIPELEKVAQRAILLKGDDETSLISAIENQDAIVLSIAPRGNQQVDVDSYEATYLHTAKNLVAALQQVDSVKQLIYTSSCSVYGDTKGDWVSEDSIAAPVSKQAQILHETEQVLLQAVSKSLGVCILRLGGIYGPGRMLSTRSSLCGTNVAGTGENFTNWSHVDDIAAGIAFALQSQLQGIYNLVNDKPVIIRDLLDQVCELNQLAKVCWDKSAPMHRGNNVRVSNQKLKAAGYKLIHTQVEI